LLTTFEVLAHNFGYEFQSMNGKNAEWWAVGSPIPAHVRDMLAENIVFHSPILVRPIERA